MLLCVLITQKGAFFKDMYEQEHVCIERKSNIMYLHFNTERNGQLKFTYDMKVYQLHEILLHNCDFLQMCVGVYHRKNYDHAKRKWPRDVDPKCCFTVVDQDDSKTLYLIADNEYIAK